MCNRNNKITSRPVSKSKFDLLPGEVLREPASWSALHDNAAAHYAILVRHYLAKKQVRLTNNVWSEVSFS